MPRPKKATASTEVNIIQSPISSSQDVLLKLQLTALLKKEVPQCFEREPTSGFTPHINKLVEHIINLLN